MRTLIVDDSNFMREFLQQHLLRMGAICWQAENGQKALELLRAEEAFDLMLVDVNMPVMNGLDCVKARQQEGLGPRMKVMMVTTEADNSFIHQALDYGADEFLMKPFTAQSLREKLVLMGMAVTA